MEQVHQNKQNKHENYNFCINTTTFFGYQLFNYYQAVYSMNGVSEPEQLKCGVEAFHGIDKDMDGL